MSGGKLWTRNFTIITLGTVISMLGNAVSGFAISLLVLDYTGSVFLYSLFLVIYNLPKIVAPMVSGPLLDRLSRRRAIYLLDFCSAGLYTLIFLLLLMDFFSFPLFAALAFVIGAIDGTYTTAYDSLYPTLITPGNYEKAYSVSSMIQPLSAVMVPVAAFLYEQVGLQPLFLFNAVSFLVAAVFETQIRTDDRAGAGATRQTMEQFRQDLREGLEYLRGQPGLGTLTVYFTFNLFCSAVFTTIFLPYFKETPGLGVVLYTVVAGCGVVGRVVGSMIQYRLRLPGEKKTLLLILLCGLLCVTDGTFLFLPLWGMMLFQLVSGLLNAGIYNIRVSGTQSYLPDQQRGRFNGTFLTMNTLGSILGQLMTGALADLLNGRMVVAGAMVLNLAGVFLLLVRRREKVEQVLNRDV